MTLDLLAFAAHRDDIELACGGLLIKMVQLGYQVGVVDMTEGEMGTRGTAQQRVQEAEEAARIMGLACRHNLAIPDARIETTEKNKRKVIQAIRTYRPRLVLAPYWENRHPDHTSTSRLVQAAAFLAGLHKFDTGQEPWRPLRLLYYMEHIPFIPSFVVDVTEQFEQKMAAVRAHRSQVYDPTSKQPETFISRPEFLELIGVRSRYYGSLVGKTHGEPYLMREMLEVEDPVTLFATTGKGRVYLPDAESLSSYQ